MVSLSDDMAECCSVMSGGQYGQSGGPRSCIQRSALIFYTNWTLFVSALPQFLAVHLLLSDMIIYYAGPRIGYFVS